MATYPVKHKETGEVKEVKMSIHDWDQWKIDNPEWERYFTPENSPGFGEVGDWRNKMNKTHPGWGEHMRKMANMPGSTVEW